MSYDVSYHSMIQSIKNDFYLRSYTNNHSTPSISLPRVLEFETARIIGTVQNILNLLQRIFCTSYYSNLTEYFLPFYVEDAENKAWSQQGYDYFFLNARFMTFGFWREVSM